MFSKIIVSIYICMLCIVSTEITSAASAQIFGAMGNDCCSAETGEVKFSDYNTNQIFIDVRASAYAGSQNGNGRGYGGSAESIIGPVREVDDQAVGSDPMMVSSLLLMTVNKVQNGRWLGEALGFGPTDMGASVPVSASAGASGEDSVGNSAVSAWVYWVEASGGTVRVSANNPAAAWVITGPEVITGSGTSAEYTNKPAGVYTLTWQPVTGYTTPVSVSLTLANNGTLSFPVGNYVAVVPVVEVDFRR
jgi:hypothetical protein